MRAVIQPCLLRGSITPPASKSQAHRLLIAAALSDGESRISGISESKDITATVSCLQALGAEISPMGEGVLRIRGTVPHVPAEWPVLDCCESGSTLRFLIPVALALCGGGRFLGRGRLMQRPQEPYFDIFREKGIRYHGDDSSLTVEGKLTAGTYRLRGDISSQFITGLMYALSLLPGESEILLTTALESAAYVDMTMDALASFGACITPIAGGWRVEGGKPLKGRDAAVEADYSQAGFYLAMQGMGSDLKICGLNPDSRQGDRVGLAYMARMDEPGEVTLDVRECPDLVPPLAARAALRAGEITRIVNAGRLRIKESDRLASVTQVLCALGADVREEPESLTIHGRGSLAGGAEVDSWNDHRIAMMAAAAATRCFAPIVITRAESVAKSYPDFWQDYAALGGEVLLEREEGETK